MQRTNQIECVIQRNELQKKSKEILSCKNPKRATKIELKETKVGPTVISCGLWFYYCSARSQEKYYFGKKEALLWQKKLVLSGVKILLWQNTGITLALYWQPEYARVENENSHFVMPFFCQSSIFNLSE